MITCSMVMYAQRVPGYQGKRTYLEYNFLSSPVILGVTKRGNKLGIGDKRSLAAWSFRNKVNMNYVTKRNSEIGGSFSFGRTGVLDTNESLGELRFTSVGLHQNRYFVKSTGALAPLGRYFRMEAQYVQSAAFFLNEPRIDFHFAYAGAGLGTRMVFRNFVTVNLSFQSGFIIPLKFSNSDAHFEHRNTVRKRLQSFYLYETNIGIGLLLF